jgi:hypothetical protein
MNWNFRPGQRTIKANFEGGAIRSEDGLMLARKEERRIVQAIRALTINGVEQNVYRETQITLE